jgi:hypothetical protein
MSKNGSEPVSTGVELLNEMRSKGIEQKIPGTERVIRLRVIDAPALLRDGKMPDILTPLIIKSVYQDLTDKELRDFIAQPKGSVVDALSYLETMDFVCERTVADGTPVNDLTLAEKRWIFRLVMGPAELLTTFRYDPNLDVADVDESDEVRQDAE